MNAGDRVGLVWLSVSWGASGGEGLADSNQPVLGSMFGIGGSAHITRIMCTHAMAKSFNDWGGRGYDDSVPGVVIETAPSGYRTAWSSTWSASLPRVRLISPGGWSNMSPGGAIFVPSPPKTGTNLRHRRPPQS